jgi:hypothetical protein
VKAVAEHNKPECRRCGDSTVLHLSFDFALDVPHKKTEVLASYHPDPLEQWCDSGGRKVMFYPFLVVMKREERDQAVWLPYWHVVRDGEKDNFKYGQWAPFMDMKLFKDLLSQARDDGYLGRLCLIAPGPFPSSGDCCCVVRGICLSRPRVNSTEMGPIHTSAHDTPSSNHDNTSELGKRGMRLLGQSPSPETEDDLLIPYTTAARSENISRVVALGDPDGKAVQHTSEDDS